MKFFKYAMKWHAVSAARVRDLFEVANGGLRIKAAGRRKSYALGLLLFIPVRLAAHCSRDLVH
eukprot:4073935-Amphidinium_carterae.1